MLTQEDLKRKSFKSHELTKITPPIFERNFKINLPDNFETILHLLKQIQFRKAVRSNQITVELEQLSHAQNDDQQLIVALKTELNALEHHRRIIHTIYTQIVTYLFFSKLGTPIYVQSPVNSPDLRNLMVLQFGEYRHRVQISKKDIGNLDIEYRGEYVKPEPSSLVCLSDDQIAEFGYPEIEIIRICRRISNYIMSVRRKFDEKIRAIHDHNFVVSQILKRVKAGEVTIEEKTEQKPNTVKATKSSTTPSESKSGTMISEGFKNPKIGFKRNVANDSGKSQKKPLNVIRKRSFVLQK